MRVGFDLTPLARPHPLGVQRVVRETLAALEARGRIEVVRLAPEAGDDLRAWRRHALPQAVRERGLVGLHSFLSAFPLRGPGRRVQTIHECPWKHGVAENAGWGHRFWASLGRRRADATIVPTRHVARDLRARTSDAGGRVHVVPWGVGEAFAEFPPIGVVDETVGARYHLPESGFVLCLGANRAKKNLGALLRGMARRIERGERALPILVSGSDTNDLRRDLGTTSKLGLTRWVSTPGSIRDEDLPSLMRLATCVPVLSLSEGFGLPVLEALACGTPVIVPAGSAQAEVAGDAGLVVDANDADAVADAIGRAQSERETLRYEVPERAREFTWDRTATAIEAIWEQWA